MFIMDKVRRSYPQPAFFALKAKTSYIKDGNNFQEIERQRKKTELTLKN